MFRLAIARDFVAQHYLIGGDWGVENQRHSHAYRVEVQMRANDLNPHGYLVDIVEVQRVLMNVLDEIRDRTLNELEEFRGLNPSLERLARLLWTRLKRAQAFAGIRLEVKVWENEADWASYEED